MNELSRQRKAHRCRWPGVLPPLVAFFAYSKVDAFDPVTRTLTGPPLGWTLSQHQGVSDGRAEFLGYFRDDDGR
jgi:hypothetical protein